jgi:hypothetical protein
VNKSGKQEATPPLSFNKTHLQQTSIDLESTYRLGVCGFRIRGNRKLVRSLSEAVGKAFNRADVHKLLLLPGHRKKKYWPTADEIAGVAKAEKLPILFETMEGASKPFYTAVSRTGKRLRLEVYQRFSTCKEAKPVAVKELVDECNPRGMRVVHIGDFTLGLLICGENNVLANKQDDYNRAYVRHGPFSNLFPGIRLIFNGAHTKMGEWGKLERRFEFLSANKRWFFYATNNDQKTWGSSTLRIYYDGCKIATSIGPASTEVNRDISWNVTLKGQKYQIPAAVVTSKDDRCRILTLDIPRKLFR